MTAPPYLSSVVRRKFKKFNTGLTTQSWYGGLPPLIQSVMQEFQEHISRFNTGKEIESWYGSSPPALVVARNFKSNKNEVLVWQLASAHAGSINSFKRWAEVQHRHNNRVLVWRLTSGYNLMDRGNSRGERRPNNRVLVQHKDNNKVLVWRLAFMHYVLMGVSRAHIQVQYRVNNEVLAWRLISTYTAVDAPRGWSGLEVERAYMILSRRSRESHSKPVKANPSSVDDI
ncbi:hypothetical protein B0H16DRAFT_1472728 [Mycena metata]|uniref:Uncharacterized protein n=1 Tax=Mycena metata TaxID=1033252 RepID=A0AAD7HMX1_9AGAR|nr:hypothetical protein B0H16DRAFT_1472728 [Mycena metata]